MLPQCTTTLQLTKESTPSFPRQSAEKYALQYPQRKEEKRKHQYDLTGSTKNGDPHLPFKAKRRQRIRTIQESDNVRTRHIVWGVNIRRDQRNTRRVSQSRDRQICREKGHLRQRTKESIYVGHLICCSGRVLCLKKTGKCFLDTNRLVIWTCNHAGCSERLPI